MLAEPATESGTLLALARHSAGHEVTSVRSTPEMLSAVVRYGADAVVVDTELAGTDGAELRETLRTLGYAGPILCVSHPPTTLNTLRAVTASHPVQPSAPNE